MGLCLVLLWYLLAATAEIGRFCDIVMPCRLRARLLWPVRLSVDIAPTWATCGHDDGRLAEEWAQTDYSSFLTKLGVTTTESAQQGARCV
jgi:hypothetical protein